MKLTPKIQLIIYIIFFAIALTICLVFASVVYEDVTCAFVKCDKVKMIK